MAIDLLTGKKIVEQKSEVKEKKKAKSLLFDHLHLMFKNKKAFDKLTNYDKAKDMFLMNRFFAIKFPVQAQLLNRMHINAAHVVQYWGNVMSAQYSEVPGWIWVGLKGVKAKKVSKKKALIVKETTMEYYCSKMQIGRKELDYAISELGDEFKQELLEIEKILEQ